MMLQFHKRLIVYRRDAKLQSINNNYQILFYLPIRKAGQKMKTEYKGVYYNEKKKIYTLKTHINGKQVQKSFKDLNSVLSYRNRLYVENNINAVTLQEQTFAHVEKIPTLMEAYPIFIDCKYRKQVRPSTINNFKSFAGKICRTLGKIQINQITQKLWQDVILSMQERQHLSSNYLYDNIRRFRQMYDYFISIGVVTENPLEEDLKLHITKKGKRRAFTPREKKIFLSTAKKVNSKFYFIFRMYFETGCRRGELLALKWQDIDFKNRTISINKAICRGDIDGKYQEFLGETKTKSSVRTIPISQRVMLILQYNFNKYNYSLNSFVFPPHKTSVYPWISLLSICKAFRKIKQECNLADELTIHCIRHTFATELLTNGVDIPTVQMLGGWSSPTTLLQIYAHSNNQHAKDVMRKVFG